MWEAVAWHTVLPSLELLLSTRCTQVALRPFVRLLGKKGPQQPGHDAAMLPNVWQAQSLTV